MASRNSVRSEDERDLSNCCPKLLESRSFVDSTRKMHLSSKNHVYGRSFGRKFSYDLLSIILKLFWEKENGWREEIKNYSSILNISRVPLRERNDMRRRTIAVWISVNWFNPHTPVCPSIETNLDTRLPFFFFFFFTRWKKKLEEIFAGSSNFFQFSSNILQHLPRENFIQMSFLKKKKKR